MEDIALADCPTCAATEEHEVLNATPNSVTLRCLECGHVHAQAPAVERPLELQLIISDQEGRAIPDSLVVIAGEEVAVGDEFEHQGRRLIVTGLEGQDGTFPSKAPTDTLRVLHAKRFDVVPLKLSLNQGETTRSFEQLVDPDEKISIGLVRVPDGVPMVVKTLKSDQNRTLHKGFLLARNVRRAFCDAAPPGAREGEMIGTRRRGAPPGAKTAPRHGPPAKYARPSTKPPGTKAPPRPAGAKPTGAKPTGAKPTGAKPGGPRRTGGKPAGSAKRSAAGARKKGPGGPRGGRRQ